MMAPPACDAFGDPDLTIVVLNFGRWHMGAECALLDSALGIEFEKPIWANGAKVQAGINEGWLQSCPLRTSTVVVHAHSENCVHSVLRNGISYTKPPRLKPGPAGRTVLRLYQL